MIAAVPSATPCTPKVSVSQCKTCARHNPGLPAMPECRPRVVAIDATVLKWPNGVCPLHIAAPRHQIVRRLSDNTATRVRVAT